jgi:hypothetical protein
MPSVPNKLGPTTFAEVQQFAKQISNSSFCPKEYKTKPGEIMVAIQLGAEVGLAPLQSLQNIAVINGRPSIYGDAMIALVKASGLLGEFGETYDEKREEYTCVSVRKDNGNKAVTRFSMDDAKRARLAGKQGPWSEYPKRMLQMRARGFNLRDNFPDVLKGLISREEAQDYPTEVQVSGEDRDMGRIGGHVADDLVDPARIDSHPQNAQIETVVPEDADINWDNPEAITERVNTVAALPTPAAEDESQEGGTDTGIDSLGKAVSAPAPSPARAAGGSKSAPDVLTIDQIDVILEMKVSRERLDEVLAEMYRKPTALESVPRKHFDALKLRLTTEAKRVNA